MARAAAGPPRGDGLPKPRRASVPAGSGTKSRWVLTPHVVTMVACSVERARIGMGEFSMAKKQADTVYKVVEVVGVSEKSWEDAGRAAVETAAGTLRDLRVAEVTQMDMKLENGKVSAFRTRVSLSFKYEA
jgi:flavin-binding protein dodecin